MVERWITQFVEDAVKTNAVSEDQKEVVIYGLLYAVHSLGGLLGISLVGWLLGLWPGILIAALIGAGFRLVSGGAHFNNPVLCFSYSTLVFAGIALTAKLLAPPLTQLTEEAQLALIALFSSAALAVGLVIVNRYVPVDTPNRPITSPEEKSRFRSLSNSLVFVLIGVFDILALTDFWNYALIILLAFGAQAFSLTPRAHRCFVWLTRITSTKSHQKAGNGRRYAE